MHDYRYAANRLMMFLRNLDGLGQVSLTTEEHSLQLSPEELGEGNELSVAFHALLKQALNQGGFLVLWSNITRHENGLPIPSKICMLELVEGAWFPLSEMDTLREFSQTVDQDSIYINHPGIQFGSTFDRICCVD